MPREHEPARPPSPPPAWVGRVLLLLGTALTASSLVRDGGRAGALTAVGAFVLGVGLALAATLVAGRRRQVRQAGRDG